MKKGWFNIFETNIDAYNFSKMKRFLTMIRFLMEDSLRFLVEDMLHRYTYFIERNCSSPRIEIKALNDVKYEWRKVDFTSVSIFLKSTKNI